MNLVGFCGEGVGMRGFCSGASTVRCSDCVRTQRISMASAVTLTLESTLGDGVGKDTADEDVLRLFDAFCVEEAC